MTRRSSPTSSPASDPNPAPNALQRELWDALYDLSEGVQKIASFAGCELEFSAETYSLRATFRQIAGACDVARRVLEKSAEAVYGDRNPYTVEG